MRNFLRSAVAVAAAALLAVGPVFAELPFTGYVSRGPIAGTSTVLDTDVALYVQYVGSATTKPTVEVSAAGLITFKVAGVADPSVACPEADDDGIIDVAQAACNTMIEVVNAINQGNSNWRAVLASSLGTDTSNDALATLSATDTNLRIGAPLFYDSNFAGSAPVVTALVAPVYPGGPADGSWFFLGPGGGLNTNPFRGVTSFLSGVSEKKTSGGTIADTQIFGVFREYRGSAATGYDLFEVIRTVWSQTGAATTVQGTLDFSNFPLISAPGEAFVVRIGSSTTISAQNLNAVGVFAQKP